MKIILEEENVKEAIKKYIESKIIGSPEVIIASKGDIEFEILINYD